MNPKVELYKLKKLLSLKGKPYTFVTYKKNEFNEKTEDIEQTKVIQALYHEQAGFINIITSTSDSGKVKSKKSPMLFTSWEEYLKNPINDGDMVMINQQRFIVAGVINVGELNIMADISLEVES